MDRVVTWLVWSANTNYGDTSRPSYQNILNGRFRNSERGVKPLAREALSQIFGLPRPLSVTLEVRTEATLGLVKCLEISKELIRECVTMPGCCCCMPLLHNHLMDSWGYVRKNTLYSPPKGGAFAPPLPPLNPPLLCVAKVQKFGATG